MNSSSQLESIFYTALEKSTAEDRAAFLAEACGGDEALRRRLERMLEAQAGSFLDSPPFRSAASVDDALLEGVGTQIGPYKLLEQIGEGGFGVVFLAEQARPVRRRVALKVIKPGMDTRQVIARFEAERQALAMMDHRNIAKVFDAGATESGRPYFVMELVQGVPITQYCDQCNLPMRERLELFVAVCQAVQHAHQKGVIHRDIKPTNVLVAMQDGQPEPKIIDFGVAKAINERLTEATIMTGFAEMLGTPLYMSPEQAELSPLGVDTRTDIYALGVLLYELLTGTTPFDKDRLQSVPYDQLCRMIREDEPPRPSARIITLAADMATTVAEHRRTDARRLRQTIRGELDWIVMRCLEKDRSRRYQTAGALIRELQRYLQDEPVEACPPSAAYRLQKFARRNRAVLLTGTLVAGALIVGSVVSVSQAIRATRAEALAQLRLKQATEARAAAEASADKSRQAVNDMYTQVAEKWLAHQPQMEPLQREFLEKALGFYTDFAEEPSTKPAVRAETARAYRRIGDIQHRFGRAAEAEDAFRKAVDRLQNLSDEIPTQPQYRAELAATLHKLGVLLGDTGRSADEEQVHRRALALEQKLLAEFPDSAAYRRDVGRGHWFLGQVLLALQRPEEAEKELRSALATQVGLVREFPTNSEYRHHLAQTYLRLGLTLRSLNRLDECHRSLTEAAEILEVLVSDYPTLPDYRNELANVYYWQVDDDNQRLNLPDDQVEQYLKHAIEIQSKLVADYPSVTDYRYDWFRSQKLLGRTLLRAGRYEEAQITLRQAAITAEKLSTHAPRVPYYRAGLAQTLDLLGESLTAAGRRADAETAYRDAIRLLNTLVTEVPAVPHHRSLLLQSYDKLESLLIAAGRTKEAAEMRRDAVRHNPAHATSLTNDDRPPAIQSDELEVTDGSPTNITTDD